MAGALTNIGYHISEKEFMREKNVGIIDLGACEVAQSLQAKLAGLLDSMTGAATLSVGQKSSLATKK